MFEQQTMSWLKMIQKGEREGWFQRQHLGYMTFGDMFPSPPDIRDFPLTAILEPALKTPDRVSQEQYVTSILDQGLFGTCVSKTNNQAHCIYHNYRGNKPTKGFSTLYNYGMCKLEDGLPLQEGTYPRISNKISQQWGTPDRLVMDYIFGPGGGLDLPKIHEWMHAEAAKFKLKTYVRLQDVGEMEQALAAGKQLRIGVLITDSFLNWDFKGLIGVPEGRIYGLHEMAATTYDRKTGMLRGPNSWSQWWGKEGFYELSYEFCNWQSDIGFKAVTEAWAMEFEDVLRYDTIVELWIDNPIARINGYPTQIDPNDKRVAPFIRYGRTMLPTRFIAEASGADDVEWDEKERKVTLRYLAKK